MNTNNNFTPGLYIVGFYDEQWYENNPLQQVVDGIVNEQVNGQIWDLGGFVNTLSHKDNHTLPAFGIDFDVMFFRLLDFNNEGWNELNSTEMRNFNSMVERYERKINNMVGELDAKNKLIANYGLENIQLSLCPFCGHDVSIEHISDADQFYVIRCACGVQMESEYVENLIVDWNCRA